LLVHAGPTSVFAVLGNKQHAIKAAASQAAVSRKRKLSVGELPEGKINRQGGVGTSKSCSKNCKWHKCSHQTPEECTDSGCGNYGIQLNQHRATCPHYTGKDKEKLKERAQAAAR
jgi:hypothetical protein